MRAAQRSAILGFTAGIALLLPASACFTGRNYTDPAGPRYAAPVPNPRDALGWAGPPSGSTRCTWPPR